MPKDNTDIDRKINTMKSSIIIILIAIAAILATLWISTNTIAILTKFIGKQSIDKFTVIVSSIAILAEYQWLEILTLNY